MVSKVSGCDSCCVVCNLDAKDIKRPLLSLGGVKKAGLRINLCMSTRWSNDWTKISAKLEVLKKSIFYKWFTRLR